MRFWSGWTNFPAAGWAALVGVAMLCSQAFGEEPPLRFDPAGLAQVSGYTLKVESLDGPVESCSKFNGLNVVRRQIHLYAAGQSNFWASTSGNTIVWGPPTGSGFQIDVLFLGKPKQTEESLKSFATSNNSFWFDETVSTVDIFDDLHFHFGAGILPERMPAFSRGEPGASARVVACLGKCTREQVASLRCHPSIGGSEGVSGAGSDTAKLQADIVESKKRVSQLEAQLEKKESEVEQQKGESKAKVKELADFLMDAKAELKETKTQLKEANALLRPNEFVLRLFSGGDEGQGKEDAPGSLSARFLDHCLDYTGSTTTAHELPPRDKDGYKTWEGKFPMAAADGKHCLVLTERPAFGQTQDFCRTFLDPKSLDGLPLDAVRGRACPPKRTVTLVYILGDVEANASEKVSIEKDLGKLLPSGELMGAGSTQLWMPTYNKFYKDLHNARTSKAKWGGGNYEFQDLAQAQYGTGIKLTLTFRPLLKALGEIAFEFTHSGGAPEPNCQAWLVVPESRRGSPKEWDQLKKGSDVFDGHRIKLSAKPDGKYRPSTKAAKLQLALKGAESLSLAFEPNEKDSPAPNCGLGTMDMGKPDLSDDELAQGSIRRVVRNVRRPFITIVTLDERWHGLTTRDKYQDFWNRALKMADDIASDKNWELAALTKLQNGFENAGELRKLAESGGHLPPLGDRSRYAESLVDEFDSKVSPKTLAPLGFGGIDRALGMIFEAVKGDYGSEGPSKTPAAILVVGAVASTEPSDFCQAGARLAGARSNWFHRGDKMLVVELWGGGAAQSMEGQKIASSALIDNLYRCDIPSSSGAGEIRIYGLVLPHSLQRAFADPIFAKLTKEAAEFLKK